VAARIKVEVDRDRCQGHGNCVLALADVFEQDAEGTVTLKTEWLPEDSLGAVQRAAYDCPTESISFRLVTDPARC
jgi:ferredoxin